MKLGFKMILSTVRTISASALRRCGGKRIQTACIFLGLSVAIAVSLSYFRFSLNPFAPSFASAGTILVFGPEDFVQGKGKPVPVTKTFTLQNPNTDYSLRILNGGRNGQFKKVLNGVITLNSVQVVKPNDFKLDDDDDDGDVDDDDDGDVDDDDDGDVDDDDDDETPVAMIEKRIKAAAENTLIVDLRSAPGSGITIEIMEMGKDDGPKNSNPARPAKSDRRRLEQKRK